MDSCFEDDLATLLALPAGWSGSEASEIVRSLAGVLLEMLRLDFIRVSLNGPREVVLGNPAAEGISTVSLPLGLRDEPGTIVAGSRRTDFPRKSERILLGVAANQATIALQRAEVAERARLEASLRTSEVNLRKIIDALPATAWSTRPDGYCDFLNDRWLDYAGFTAEQAEGWGWAAVIHPDDAPGLTEYWQGCLAAGKPVDTEARMRGADGTYRWFLFRADPFRDETGRIVKWYGTNIDIEDRKRLTEKLRESEREARLIVDCIPTQVAVLGPAGDIQQVNRQMAEFFGKEVDRLDSWRTNDIVPADELPRVRAGMAESLETGRPFMMENRLRRFDGVYRWSQVRGLPLKDAEGRVLHWYFSIADIEERKLAEEALRRSETFLAEAQKISQTGSFSWRLETDEITFSEELRRIFELDETIVVTLEQIGLRVHPDDAPRLSGLIDQARQTGGDDEYEIRLRMPDGRVKHVRTVSHVIHHPHGQRECLGAVQDVTHRHLSEEALDKARSELAHVSRILSLGALTASIAHEVNQPLAGIVTNAGTCLRMLAADPPDVDGARETVRRMMRDSHRAADVITRLRELFKKSSTMTEAVDLNDAAREVISLLSGDLQRSRAVVRIELDDDSLLVTGDRVQLQQVVMNLIRNACDAMSEVDDRPRRLLIRTERDGESARLSVRDAGAGLGREDVERIFDAFYTTKSDGMGIGLSVSRSIIERHRGKLWAESHEGPGATFAFSIPCAPRARARSHSLHP